MMQILEPNDQNDTKNGVNDFSIFAEMQKKIGSSAASSRCVSESKKAAPHMPLLSLSVSFLPTFKTRLDLSTNFRSNLKIKEVLGSTLLVFQKFFLSREERVELYPISSFLN